MVQPTAQIFTQPTKMRRVGRYPHYENVEMFSTTNILEKPVFPAMTHKDPQENTVKAGLGCGRKPQASMWWS